MFQFQASRLQPIQYMGQSRLCCVKTRSHTCSIKCLKVAGTFTSPCTLYRPRWVCLGVLPSDSSHWQGPGAIEPCLPTTCALPTEIPLPAGWQNTAALSTSLGLDCLYGCDAYLLHLKLFLWLRQFVPVGGPFVLWSS